MPTVQLRGATVTAHAAAPSAIDGGTILVESLEQLAAADLPMADLVAIWNGLPGVTPVSRFKDRKIAARRLWAEFEKLPIVEPAMAPPAPASGQSKQAMVIAMLQHPGGATLDEIVSATGWQRHTVRGAISGALKKKLGLIVQSARREDGQRTYSIA